MLCAGCGTHQCGDKSNIAEQKSAKLYNFCATLLILRMTANSVQNPACAESQNSDIPTSHYLGEVQSKVTVICRGTWS